MKIISPDTDYCNHLFNHDFTWHSLHTDNKEVDLSLCSDILESSTLYYTEFSNSNSGKCLLVIQRTAVSQFDKLVELSGKRDFSSELICLAGSGENFHGMKKRKWIAEEGNLHLVFSFCPDRNLPRFDVGSMVLSAVAIIQTLKRFAELQEKVKIKWVNDILLDGKKLGGIIANTQSQGDRVKNIVIGIGLNIKVAPIIEEGIFIDESTCLNDYFEFNDASLFSKILFELIQNIETNYQILLDGGYTKLFPIYKSNSCIINKQVNLFSDSSINPELLCSGRVVDINENLGLQFEGSDKIFTKGRISKLGAR